MMRISSFYYFFLDSTSCTPVPILLSVFFRALLGLSYSVSLVDDSALREASSYSECSSYEDYSRSLVDSSTVLESPKSQIFTVSPFELIRTLAGLRSRWMMLAEWRYLILNKGKGTRTWFDKKCAECVLTRKSCHQSWIPSGDRCRRTLWLGKPRWSSPGSDLWEWWHQSSGRCWGAGNSWAGWVRGGYAWFQGGSQRDLWSSWWRRNWGSSCGQPWPRGHMSPFQWSSLSYSCESSRGGRSNRCRK